MTINEKKAWLQRYRVCGLLVDRLNEERAVWMDRATKCTATISDAPRGGEKEDRIQAAVERIVDLENQILDETDAALRIREEIMSAVENIENDRQRMVLLYRYIDGKRWEEVAYRLGVAWTQVHRLHREAVKKLDLTKLNLSRGRA